MFGLGWTFTYGLRLVEVTDGLNTIIILRRASGHRDRFFRNSDGTYASPPDVFDRLRMNQDGTWDLTQKDGKRFNFDANGTLISVVDRNNNRVSLAYDPVGALATVTDESSGRFLVFSKGANGKIASVTDPENRVVHYEYDLRGNLIKVIDPIGATTQYTYDSQNNLTGIVDAKGVVIAQATYDSLTALLIGYMENGVTYALTRLPLQKTIIEREPTGLTRTIVYNDNGNIVHIVDQLGNIEDIAYDAHFNPDLITDKNGNAIALTYDNQGNLVSRQEPGGLLTTFTYDAVLNLPVTVSENGKVTTFRYDAKGNLLEKTITVGTSSRAWAYAYSAQGQLQAVDGPRTDVSDVTSYAYDSAGNVSAITNALGQTVRIPQYDATGRALRIEDSNGVVTTLGYDGAGRLTSFTESGDTTTYTYDLNGLVASVSFPRGQVLSYEYDSYGRATRVTDNGGNAIRYSLDPKGNIVKEEFFDPQGTLRRTRSHAYDSVNRKIQDIGAAGQATRYLYDKTNRITGTISPLGRSTTSAYDAMGRLILTTDAAGSQTQYQYDQLGQLSRVTDPLGNSTDYVIDGFGNLVTLKSPDEGIRSRTYDAAGNVLTETDARGRTTGFEYDAVNRLIRTVFDDGTDEVRTYAVANGQTGRLARIRDPQGSTSWTYDAQGRVIERQQELDGVSLSLRFTYDLNGRLTQMTYPSGSVVNISYDPRGAMSSIQLDGQLLLDQLTYQPFGPVAGWTWGNGTPYARTFDLDGRVTGVPMGPAIQAVSYDAASHVSGLSGSTAATYTYDVVDRLNSMATATITQSYTYDANGNRQRFLQSGQVAIDYTYRAGSNQLQTRVQGSTQQAYAYDAAGNLSNDGTHAFGYNGRGRLVEERMGSASTTYQYNGLGQRIAKRPSGAVAPSQRFLYDEAGHLIGEYDGAGAPIQETIYLGDIPVAVIKEDTGPGYIYTDHINTPRLITDLQNNVVWRWDSDPFGVGLVDQDPNGDGIPFIYNARFRGQQFDVESGLHYNYFRDYDPSLGRYVQSDPVGLRGGTNTYGYVKQDPLGNTDARGLWSGADALLVLSFYFGGGGYVDISGWCADYLADAVISAYMDLLKTNIDLKTRQLVGLKGNTTFVLNQSNSLYVTSIYSFGSGTHKQDADCTADGDGCCVSSSCKLTAHARDRFDDPVDLCQTLKICGGIRNVGGTPFTFGISCNDNYSTKKCK